MLFFFFFFNDTATTEIYTLSLHDALPILGGAGAGARAGAGGGRVAVRAGAAGGARRAGRGFGASTVTCGTVMEIGRAHVELQSHSDIVCRLLLGKKKQSVLTTSRPSRHVL